MKTTKTVKPKRLHLTEIIAALAVLVLMLGFRSEYACAGAQEGHSEIQKRKTAGIQGGADRNSLETKKATESTALHIQTVEKQQLFGTVVSWKLHPPDGQANARIIAWLEEVSDPSHPRRLDDELNRRLDGDGLLQYGFI